MAFSVSVEVSLVGDLLLHCFCHAWSTSSNLGTGAIVEQICKITKILKITEFFPKRHSPLLCFSDGKTITFVETFYLRSVSLKVTVLQYLLKVSRAVFFTMS